MKRISIASIGLVLLMGCGSKSGTGSSVSGTITYKGKPVNGALLHLYPQSDSTDAGAVMVPVSQEGQFSGFEIPPGEYKVVVEGQEIPKMDPPQGASEEIKQKFIESHSQDKSTIPFPNKYKSVLNTDLKCTINEDQSLKLDLDLKD